MRLTICMRIMLFTVLLRFLSNIYVMKKVTCFLPYGSKDDVCAAGLRGLVRMFYRNGYLYFVVDRNRFGDFVDDMYYKFGFHVFVKC